MILLGDPNYPIFIFVSKEVIGGGASVSRNTPQEVRPFVLIFSGLIMGQFQLSNGQKLFRVNMCSNRTRRWGKPAQPFLLE